MLGQRERKSFLNISGGKIVQRTESGKTLYFDFVEGDLERIYQRDREFRGEKVPYWYLDIRDPKSGEIYSLGISASSGVWCWSTLRSPLIVPVRSKSPCLQNERSMWSKKPIGFSTSYLPVPSRFKVNSI